MKVTKDDIGKYCSVEYYRCEAERNIEHERCKAILLEKNEKSVSVYRFEDRIVDDSVSFDQIFWIGNKVPG